MTPADFCRSVDECAQKLGSVTRFLADHELETASESGQYRELLQYYKGVDVTTMMVALSRLPGFVTHGERLEAPSGWFGLRTVYEGPRARTGPSR